MNLIEPILYLDEQAAAPAGLCPVCAGECYGVKAFCLRCERRGR